MTVTVDLTEENTSRFAELAQGKVHYHEAGVGHPVILIHGRDDRVVHFENTLRLVSTIKRSRAVILNECGHWAQI